VTEFNHGLDGEVLSFGEKLGNIGSTLAKSESHVRLRHAQFFHASLKVSKEFLSDPVLLLPDGLFKAFDGTVVNFHGLRHVIASSLQLFLSVSIGIPVILLKEQCQETAAASGLPSPILLG